MAFRNPQSAMAGPVALFCGWRSGEPWGLRVPAGSAWMGEFGRTPKHGPKGGRDHYAQAFSSVLLGGGIKGGQVIGRTDKFGASVEDRRVSPADFFATIYQLLGIDPKKEHQASGGRPIRIAKEGARPIGELLP